MKKTFILSFLLIPFVCLSAEASNSAARQFQGSGTVVTVDPVYAQITIDHGAIKDFGGAGQTEFYVTSVDFLKGLAKNDLVEFEIIDTKGDVRISKISKTGVAPPKEEGLPLGQAVQETLEGAGNVVRGVTSPVPLVHEVAEGATTVTDATGDAVKDANAEAKSKF